MIKMYRIECKERYLCSYSRKKKKKLIIREYMILKFDNIAFFWLSLEWKHRCD